jgi:hypothetical protein
MTLGCPNCSSTWSIASLKMAMSNLRDHYTVTKSSRLDLSVAKGLRGWGLVVVVEGRELTGSGSTSQKSIQVHAVVV